MLDARLHRTQARLFEWAVTPLVRAKVSPNQVTAATTLLSIGNAAAFAWHRNALLFGALLLLFEIGDDLDGALARRTGQTSKFGAYLDAVTDRYKDSAALLSVAWVTGHWFLGFLAVTGSLLTSYNKARAGMEAPIENTGWSEPFERLERVLTLGVGAILCGVFPVWQWQGLTILGWTLAILAAMSHLSAVLRVARAWSILRS